jgi:hypothetical protein
MTNRTSPCGRADHRGLGCSETGQNLPVESIYMYVPVESIYMYVIYLEYIYSLNVTSCKSSRFGEMIWPAPPQDRRVGWREPSRGGHGAVKDRSVRADDVARRLSCMASNRRRGIVGREPSGCGTDRPGVGGGSGRRFSHGLHEKRRNADRIAIFTLTGAVWVAIGEPGASHLRGRGGRPEKFRRFVSEKSAAFRFADRGAPQQKITKCE